MTNGREGVGVCVCVRVDQVSTEFVENNNGVTVEDGAGWTVGTVVH